MLTKLSFAPNRLDRTERCSGAPIRWHHGFMRAILTALIVITTVTLITPTAAQQLMGVRAEWGDLQTWTTDISNTREQEVGLGLHLSGSSGGTLLAFIARVDTRQPNQAPDEMVAQVAIGSLTNPNALRQPTLSFVLDDGEGNTSGLDLTGRLIVDDSTPGGSVQNGVAVFPASDFVDLASAEAVGADVLGFDAELRQDQIRAIRAFAERLNLDTGR